ncbi:3145_t:CDS:1 [Acaulospora colombiana]|uniref:3145_t:CDS:1 n=1 Tax=Acaulospora colombiana TaxID=27376 RepID=A0ACA9KNQ9_9GLOM|nr:3145_t:CDS:1 [Acaulospora colombiana]
METFDYTESNETRSFDRENSETGTESNRRWSQKTMVDFMLPGDDSHDDVDAYPLKNMSNKVPSTKKEDFDYNDDSLVNGKIPAYKETLFLNITNGIKKALHTALSHNYFGKTTSSHSNESKKNITTSKHNYSKYKRNSLKSKKFRKVTSFGSMMSSDIPLSGLTNSSDKKKELEGDKYAVRKSSFEEDSEDDSTLIDLDEYMVSSEEENEECFVMDSHKEIVKLLDLKSFVDDHKISDDKLENVKCEC